MSYYLYLKTKRKCNKTKKIIKKESRKKSLNHFKEKYKKIKESEHTIFEILSYTKQPARFLNSAPLKASDASISSAPFLA